MTPKIIKTETETVIIIPHEDKPETFSQTLNVSGGTENGTYFYNGKAYRLPEEVLIAALLWKKGKTAAAIARGCKLKVKGRNAFDADTGQRLLGAIRRVLPALLPPRVSPNKGRS